MGTKGGEEEKMSMGKGEHIKKVSPVTECKRMDEILSVDDPPCCKHQQMVDDE
jgi:hypothetical protein